MFELAELVKIIFLAELVGITTVATAIAFFKLIGIDFKKWMARHGKKYGK